MGTVHYLAQSAPAVTYVLHFDLAQVLGMLIGTVLPFLSGLVTRWNASDAARAVVLLVLSALSGFLSTWLGAAQDGTAFDVAGAILTAATAFVFGIGAYLGLWKPTGVGPAVNRTGGFIGGSRSSLAA
jgi:peptidoglycan/LPS O-acetylase OafA/YrhL